MKILYVPGRWDPTMQNEYSGSDYGAYHMLKKQPNVKMFMVEPLEDKPNLIEKIITRLYGLFFSKRLIKYYPSSLRQIGKVVNQTIRDTQPDVIFSKYSAPIVHANIDRPFVYMCDSTVKWTKEVWPVFSKLGFLVMEKWEEKSIQACDRLITFSEASAEIIKDYYKKDPEKVTVFPIPAYIPKEYIPLESEIGKKIGNKLNLLMVGKRFKLRGMDIAIEVVNLLNQKGFPTELKVVGLDREDETNVKFMGAYNKEDPVELKSYFGFFKWADLLIHPSRFHAAGIVISEAAAFGVPTITNASGGLATSVQHDRTGIVLPEESPPSVYANAIAALIEDKERYKEYRKAAKKRFDEKLNWEKAGERLYEIIKEVHKN